jgi:ferrous iron transport protein A
MVLQAINKKRTLAALADGQFGVIHQYTHDVIASKLMSMGILPGKSLKLVRRLPFGGGLYVKVGNQNIALRQEEAENILVISA